MDLIAKGNAITTCNCRGSWIEMSKTYDNANVENSNFELLYLNARKSSDRVEPLFKLTGRKLAA